MHVGVGSAAAEDDHGEYGGEYGRSPARLLGLLWLPARLRLLRLLVRRVVLVGRRGLAGAGRPGLWSRSLLLLLLPSGLLGLALLS